MSAEHKNIDKKFVTVGGGTGLPIANEALHLTDQVPYVTSIVTVFDSGGATGKERRAANGKRLAYGDVRRALLSTVHPHDKDGDAYREFRALLEDRDKNNFVLGHQLIHRRFDRDGDAFGGVTRMMKAFGLDVRGEVLPPSTTAADLMFTVADPKNPDCVLTRYKGEHHLDEITDAVVVKDMWLESADPERATVDAYQPAAHALKTADVTVLAQGGPLGSIFPNFLPSGMREASEDSQSRLVVVANAVSLPLENPDDTPVQIVGRTIKYAGRRPDVLIVPGETTKELERRHPETAAAYKARRAQLLGWGTQSLRAVERLGVEVVMHNAIDVETAKDGTPEVRTNSKRLSEALQEAIS